MNKDLYLVRHGQTIFNLKRIIQAGVIRRSRSWAASRRRALACSCERVASSPTTPTPRRCIAPSRLSPTCGRALLRAS